MGAGLGLGAAAKPKAAAAKPKAAKKPEAAAKSKGKRKRDEEDDVMCADFKHCDAPNCIIGTKAAHDCLRSKGIFKIEGVCCSGKGGKCTNQTHICCSDQLKKMTLSEIEDDDFDFYCHECQLKNARKNARKKARK